MKYVFLLLIAISVSSCVKDKLEEETLILEGNWRWNYSIMYTYDNANDTTIQTIIPASNYPDTYGIEILKKGKLIATKSGADDEKYRLVLPYFKSGLCDLNNSYSYQIHLNNDPDKLLSGCVNKDTLITNDLHLPLSQSDPTLPYYFKHYFIK